jgi:hypothetical protein
MKTYKGVDVYIHIFLTSALIGGEWSDSRLGRFTPGKESLVPIVYEDGWIPEPVWKTWRSENSWPYRALNSDTSVVQPVASQYISFIYLFIQKPPDDDPYDPNS